MHTQPFDHQVRRRLVADFLRRRQRLLQVPSNHPVRLEKVLQHLVGSRCEVRIVHTGQSVKHPQPTRRVDLVSPEALGNDVDRLKEFGVLLLKRLVERKKLRSLDVPVVHVRPHEERVGIRKHVLEPLDHLLLLGSHGMGRFRCLFCYCHNKKYFLYRNGERNRMQPDAGIDLPGCWHQRVCQSRDMKSTLAFLLTLPALLVVALTPDPDHGGLDLPEGFAAVVVHEGVASRARHLVVRDNGDIYVRLRRTHDGHGIAALRDTNGDGRADLTRFFIESAGTGIDVFEGYLYYSTPTEIWRVLLPEDDALVPTAQPERIVGGFLPQSSHRDKPFTISRKGDLFVNVGAPSNACQERARTRGSPGLRPCPQLERQAGIWLFDARTPDQDQVKDGVRYATGLRNCIALDWNSALGELYAVPHGRDQLDTLFPDLYSAEENAKLPAEEFHRIPGPDFDAGWPYTYWNHLVDARIVAPEYGGDSETVSENNDYADPIQTFPGHWAPNDLLFYTGEQFPERYRNSAFVAFHGSWNRSPLVQRGYKVTFTPFGPDGLPSGDFEEFAVGFPMTDLVRSPRDAKHRPMGLATGPDGSLYITDSVDGRIWRIFYVDTND